ncbi:hypothetical protein [Streptomyces sp. NPDC101234]|uniref:hypothetical protein n=1 Tax=Streptomyces sp. NPDC101234 TaxID=3366138 RepID=UPI00381DE4C6
MADEADLDAPVAASTWSTKDESCWAPSAMSQVTETRAESVGVHDSVGKVVISSGPVSFVLLRAMVVGGAGGIGMSLESRSDDGVPELAARVVRASFPKGTSAIRIRDVLGALFTDEDFAGGLPGRGSW